MSDVGGLISMFGDMKKGGLHAYDDNIMMYRTKKVRIDN